MISSRDGISWNKHLLPSPSAISSVAYDNGRFIAVGNNGVVLESGRLPSARILRAASRGSIRLSIEGGVSQAFVIESTASLTAPVWSEVGRITNSSADTAFNDTVTTDPSRFYRVREIAVPAE